MDEAMLLTDDEMVALCIIDGRPWPLGLMTVGTTSDELTQAGLRGVRSLLVRRLLTGSKGADALPDPTVAREVAAFIGAETRVGAHVALAADRSVLAGASVNAALTADGWLLDTATADGIHALRRVSADDAAATVIDFVEAVHASHDGGGQDVVASIVVAGSPVQEWNPALIREAFGAEGAQ
jgi:hypothetical protein